MNSLFFVSSNPGKLQEYQKLLLPFDVRSLNFSLSELQIENLKQLCEYKLAEAAEKIEAEKTCAQPQTNLFIEDTALYFQEWKSFPGVFIKWMLQSLGPEGIYRSLRAFRKTAYAECCIAFYEPISQKKYYFQGRLAGTIVSPRGKTNFGWDSIFVPQGHQKTFAEMGGEEKNSISHRYLAAQKFLAFLKEKSSQEAVIL